MAARKPSPSVELPVRWPPLFVTQFTLPRTFADSSRSSTILAISIFNGMVTERPRKPSALINSTIRCASPSPASIAALVHANPISWNAARCKSGERECSIGRPTTPTAWNDASVIATAHSLQQFSHWLAAHRRCWRMPLSLFYRQP